MVTSGIDNLAEKIVEARLNLSPHRTLLVGISGIDASGKGFITNKLEKQLRGPCWNIAALSADDWLNLPSICINRHNPAEQFYEHALRLDAMFADLVTPLRKRGEVDIVADCGDAKAIAHKKKQFRFREIDIVLLEGIFLFKAAYRDHFDLRVWIDCSFETALQRAIERGQESLSLSETKHAFQTIYFPAQRLHLQRDNPREHANIIFNNDVVAGIGDADPC